ncbi:MAG: FAD-dependent monooxygenase [Myxococcales bacterium]|nr:MAG: FAD-dependent monooxygenase [Myxococcales bacterium]
MGSNISIIGAGLNGLMCAAMLARRGFNVEIFEKRSIQNICAPKYNINGKIGRSMSMDISARGIHALKEIEIFDEVIAHCTPMNNKIYHLQNNHNVTIPYGRNDSESILCISRTDLFNILYKNCLSHKNITFNFRYILHDIDTKLRLLNFIVPDEKREAQVSTDIVIGTDGVNSKVREILERENNLAFKKTLSPFCYKELAIPKNKKLSLELNAMHIWPRQQFMLVAQPNSDASFTCALILKNDDSRLSFKNIKGDSSIIDFFETYFPDIANYMPALASEYKENPVGFFKIILGSRWVFGDFLLILGDAAHGMVPFFGQGVNCGFEDCTVLSQLLEQNNDHWPSTMKMFNETRVPNANAINSMSSINYPELLDNPNLEKIMQEKLIENILSRNYSNDYRTYHNLVCFDRTPYSTVEKIRSVQKKFLSQIDLSALNLDRTDDIFLKNLIDKYKEELRTNKLNNFVGV